MLAVLGAFKISQFFRKKYLLFIFGALILFQPLSSFFDFKDTIYELADSGDIVNFVWARQNLPENSIALADEKKSIALFSVSGIKTSFHDEAVTKIFDFPCINYNAITEKNIAYFYEPKNKCDFLADLGRGFYKVI